MAQPKAEAARLGELVRVNSEGEITRAQSGPGIGLVTGSMMNSLIGRMAAFTDEDEKAVAPANDQSTNIAALQMQRIIREAMLDAQQQRNAQAQANAYALGQAAAQQALGAMETTILGARTFSTTSSIGGYGSYIYTTGGATVPYGQAEYDGEIHDGWVSVPNSAVPVPYPSPRPQASAILNPCPKCKMPAHNLAIESMMVGSNMAFVIRCPSCGFRLLNLDNNAEMLFKLWNETPPEAESRGEEFRKLDSGDPKNEDQNKEIPDQSPQAAPKPS